jgi:hypothetical protein
MEQPTYQRFGKRRGYYMHVNHVNADYFLSRFRWFAVLIMRSYNCRFTKHLTHLVFHRKEHQ